MARLNNIASVLARDALLNAIHADPAAFSLDHIVRAISNQSALSKYVDIERGITSLSLNTLKTVANKNIAGGFKNLDFKRASAAELLKSITLPIRTISSRNKKERNLKIHHLELQVSQYEEDLFHLSQAFWSSLKTLRKLAKDSRNQALILEAEAEEKRLRLMASLMSRRLLEVVT